MNDRSAWAPLAHKPFRALWCAGAVVNLAIWMQTVGAAWIMTTLSSSPLMVSLVQTAMTLPVFLFGLPGGVVADLVDRRRWLIFTQGTMLLAAVLLCGLAFAGFLQDWSLLLLTFLLGTGSALNMSAWMATTVAVLPRDQVPAAVSLSAISTNVARALGPALAGLLIAWTGSASVFVVRLIAASTAPIPMQPINTPYPPASSPNSCLATSGNKAHSALAQLVNTNTCFKALNSTEEWRI